MPAQDRPELTFLIARPRSGTTWLQKAVSMHPAIHCTELKVFGGQFDVIKDRMNDGSTRLRKRSCMDSYFEAAYEPLNLRSAGIERQEYETDMVRMLAHQISGYIADKTGATTIIDKMTPVERPDVAERLLKAFPDAKFAYLVRDGRDIAVSFAFDWLTKAHGPGGTIDTASPRYQRFVDKKPVTVERFFTDREIRNYAQNWVDAINIFYPLAKFTFSYEDMKTGLDSVLRGYFDFLGIPYMEDDIIKCCEGASFTAMAGKGAKEGDATRVSSATRRGIARGWVDYLTRRDADIFEEVAGPTLLELGYETSWRWVEELPDKLIGFSGPIG